MIGLKSETAELSGNNSGNWFLIDEGREMKEIRVFFSKIIKWAVVGDIRKPMVC